MSALPDRLPEPPERSRAAGLGVQRQAVPGRIVYKFGGTSVADAECMREVARLVAAAPTRPVLVVSAMAGVTDRLVAVAESIRDGNDLWRDLLPELEMRHANVLLGLTRGDAPDRSDLESDLAANFARIAAAAGRSWQGCEAELVDEISSLGEDLSARLAAQALRASGVAARFVDARSVVRTDDHFGRARPLSDEIARLARERLVPLLQQGTVPVLQGFVGATADGRTTTLGRGGSDYSAAILGAAVAAEEVHIWTDVDGILSGDPRAVDNPRILPEVGFEEAVELSYFGAKVIHPGAAKHAIALGVPVRIRNTFRPEAQGTLISPNRRGSAEIAAIAYKGGSVLMKVRALPSALPYGFLARVFDVLARHELAVDLVATSHSSTAFTIDRHEELSAVEDELSDFAEVEVRRGLATVTVVGHGLMEEPGTDALVFWEVSRTPVHLISQASDVSLSFLVDEDRAADLVRRLHTSLIELRDEEGESAHSMKVALLGYGKMGRAVEAAAGARGHEVVARLDAGDAIDRDALGGAEVAIDFTAPDAVEENARLVAKAGTDLVIGTTGWYDRMKAVEGTVREGGIGCVWSPNFSLGVQIFFRLAAEAGRLADGLEEYDVHVHEAHHRHKLDHPSGTARKLADVLVEALARKTSWREGPAEGAPDPAVLWVSSARAGEIPGTHEVALEGPADSIVLRHVARGREGFAGGAVAAAEWVRGRKGFFAIDEMLADRFGQG